MNLYKTQNYPPDWTNGTKRAIKKEKIRARKITRIRAKIELNREDGDHTYRERPNPWNIC